MELRYGALDDNRPFDTFGLSVLVLFHFTPWYPALRGLASCLSAERATWSARSASAARS
jgi:hypothetical protein